MSKNKKIIINIVCGIVILFSGFCAGRFIRFGGISGASGELVEGILLTGDTADRVLDELGIARPAGQSAADLGYAVARGIGKLRESNETARVCLDEINREVTNTQQNIEVIQQSFTGVSDAMELGFRLAEEQAGAYERITSTLQQFNSNSSENE